MRLYGILTSLPIAKSAKKVDEDLKLERKLAAELIKNWRETYTDALTQIFAAIPDLGNKTLAKKISKTIENGLAEALGDAYGNSKKAYKRLYKRSLLDF